jgi:hypothetical protein
MVNVEKFTLRTVTANSMADPMEYTLCSQMNVNVIWSRYMVRIKDANFVSL